MQGMKSLVRKPISVLLFGLITVGCNSSKPGSPASTEQAPSTISTTESDTALAQKRQGERDAFAQNISSIFRRHGVDAAANMVNDELVVSGEDLERRSQRDALAGSVFTKQVQQRLCDMGVHKVLVSAKGAFGDSNEYNMTCKLSAAEALKRDQLLRNGREKFAAQLAKDLSVSPVVSGVEAGETELVIIGKQGIDQRVVSSSLGPALGRDFMDAACGMGFKGLRVRKPALDRGVFSSFHCKSKN